VSAADAEKDELAARLGDVQRKLVEMEAETGPARAGLLLAGLGFSDADQKMATRSFSGGWRMRLALARALFVKPDVGHLPPKRSRS
jgi:ATP-binding cassette subfamily F protein 3